MRGTFVKTITELAGQDRRILLLTADLGYNAMEPFMEKFPDRFFNTGVAEQNMVGLATGLAEAGFIPFVYSIVTFASLRPYEFIRNGPIAHQFPVRIVGVGGGVEYGQNGISHYGLEDVGIMRVQPGITIIAPADSEQARTAILATWNLPGPVYYRFGKDDKTVVPDLNGRFEIGRAQIIGEGKDLAIVAMGNVSSEAAKAVTLLAGRGVQCTLVIVAGVNPAPIDDLARVLSQFRLAMTVEAHYVTGGLGSLVSEVIADKGLNCRLTRCAFRSTPSGICGSQDYLYGTYGLSADSLVQTAIGSLGEGK